MFCLTNVNYNVSNREVISKMYNVCILIMFDCNEQFGTNSARPFD